MGVQAGCQIIDSKNDEKETFSFVCLETFFYSARNVFKAIRCFCFFSFFFFLLKDMSNVVKKKQQPTTQVVVLVCVHTCASTRSPGSSKPQLVGSSRLPERSWNRYRTESMQQDASAVDYHFFTVSYLHKIVGWLQQPQRLQTGKALVFAVKNSF